MSGRIFWPVLLFGEGGQKIIFGILGSRSVYVAPHCVYRSHPTFICLDNSITVLFLTVLGGGVGPKFGASR